MDTSSILGRSIIVTRRFFNNIDLQVFGASLVVVTGAVVWLLLGSAFLPAHYDLQPGDVAPDLIRAPRTLTFENTAETQRRQAKAADEATGVYSFDAAVLTRVTRNIGGYFDNAARIVNEERAAAQAGTQPYDPAKAARRIKELGGQPVIADSAITALATLEATRQAELHKAILDSVQRIMEANVTETSLPTDTDRCQAVIGTSNLTQSAAATAGQIATALR